MQIINHSHIYLVRELLNCALAVLCTNLSFTLGLYMYRARQEFEDSIMRKWYATDWIHQSGLQTACVLWWVFTAEAFRAGAAFLSLHTGFVMQTIGSTAILPLSIDIAYLGSAAVLVMALLRCTYLFTPARFGHRMWIASAFETGLACAGSMLFKMFGY